MFFIIIIRIINSFSLINYLLIQDIADCFVDQSIRGMSGHWCLFGHCCCDDPVLPLHNTETDYHCIHK